MLKLYYYYLYKGDCHGLLQTVKGTSVRKRLYSGTDRFYSSHTAGTVQQIRERKTRASD